MSVFAGPVTLLPEAADESWVDGLLFQSSPSALQCQQVPVITQCSAMNKKLP